MTTEKEVLQAVRTIKEYCDSMSEKSCYLCPVRRICDRCFVGIPDEWPDLEEGSDENESYIATTEENPNSNFIPPPITESNTISPTVGTKCPYRKIYLPKSWWDGKWHTEDLMKATKIEVEFQDCIGKECACWTPIGCKL